MTRRAAIRCRHVVLWVLLAVFVLIGGPWIATSVGIHGREVDDHTRDVPPVGIVLGAAVLPSGEPSRYLRARLDLAQSLYEKGTLKVLVVSGDGREDHNNEPEAMRRYLLGKGVPDEHIVIDAAGYDTYATCVRAKEVFGIDRAVLVSQAYHVPRAVTTCRAVGVDALGAGDHTVQTLGADSWPGPLKKLGWGRFVLRERLAGPKMVVDVATRRQPVLGPPSDAVQVALDR